MPSTPSVQLPDLLSLSRAFDLRTNRHCHAVTHASEQWFATQGHALTEDERASLRSLKIGLWASTCFPTSDLPQLRLATDFLTLLLTCNARLSRARTLCDCGWTEGRSQGGWECLSDNILFRPLMERIAAAMSMETWRENFRRSSEAFRISHMQILAHRRNNTLPSVEAYVELRRDLSGMPMVFDLIEMAEGLKMASCDEPWKSLKRFAADIIALSTDIFAYSNDQLNDNSFNIVSIIQAEKGLSVQSAINSAYALIESSFRNFLTVESAVFLARSPPSPVTPSWTWNLLSRKEPPVTTPGQPPPDPDAKLYVQGLKDGIVGTINWSYETELYFGVKGDEIRQFGWVFLRQPLNEGDQA
ncbi:isoprenoid synthase domain-containing protein [Mycena latifolia]|nr:isoprenoid synthase domain-containing protein [Mycena latifolia]